MRNFHTILCTSLLVVSLGCNMQSSPTDPAAKAGSNTNPSTIAVIDLDQVAQRLGRVTDIKDSVQKREQALNKQLATIQVSYNQQLEEKQRSFGEQPTPDQMQQLQSIKNQMASNLQQVQLKARTDLATHQSQLINSFREQIKPVAQEIARQQGMSLVVSKNENFLFTVDPACDITEAVIEQLLKENPKFSQVQPALPTPSRYPAEAEPRAVPTPLQQAQPSLKPVPQRAEQNAPPAARY